MLNFRWLFLDLPTHLPPKYSLGATVCALFYCLIHLGNPGMKLQHLKFQIGLKNTSCAFDTLFEINFVLFLIITIGHYNPAKCHGNWMENGKVMIGG